MSLMRLAIGPSKLRRTASATACGFLPGLTPTSVVVNALSLLITTLSLVLPFSVL